MLCSGIGDGTDMGEPVEPAVDTERVPGAVLLSSGESGCHARVHRQIDVAIVDAYEDHLIEVVAQIGLRLMVVQPGDGFCARSGTPQVLGGEDGGGASSIELHQVRVSDSARAEHGTDQDVGEPPLLVLLGQLAGVASHGLLAVVVGGEEDLPNDLFALGQVLQDEALGLAQVGQLTEAGVVVLVGVQFSDRVEREAGV
ncbi:hypothetical protein ABZS96_40275 [Streptomyces avermitilis]|uniref:hypothetical protein n=1 Tax=Streptomyces avermitilis TaxID=33903 RepID=UPI0033ADDB6C